MGVPLTPIAGNPDATALVSQMRPALLRYFRRKIGSDAEAEDLTQDVIVRALAHIHWDNPVQARGYIFRAAVNRWRDQRRRARTRGVVVEWNEDTAGESGAGDPPEYTLIHREELQDVLRVLRSLPQKTRTVVTLIRFEHMKIAAVAEALGTSTRAIHRHLAKAMESFQHLRDMKDGAP